MLLVSISNLLRNGANVSRQRRNRPDCVIIDKVIAFRNERDWEQFHNAKDLAICLSCESAELLELFMWKGADEVNVDKVKEELADVLYSAFLLVDKYQLDVDEIVSAKLKANAEKYPVGKAKGLNKKWDEL